jgi:hypothetical protein
MKRSWLFPIVVALAAAPALADDDEAPEGFTSIFNGKDLTGWKVNEGANMKVWGADNGILYVEGAGGGWLMTEKEYSDFQVRVEYKLTTEDGNSGVALRSPMRGDAAYVGMEIQILNDPWYLKNYRGLKRVQLTGSIYGVVAPSKEAIRPVGEWNKMDITARGRHVTVKVNGTKVVDADLDEHKDQFKAHPGLTRKKGHIGLQSHTGRVEFRHIYVKDLSR